MEIDLYYGPRGAGHTLQLVEAFNEAPDAALLLIRKQRGFFTRYHPAHVVLSTDVLRRSDWREVVLGRFGKDPHLFVDDYFQLDYEERGALEELIHHLRPQRLYLSGAPGKAYHRIDVEEVRAQRVAGQRMALLPLDRLIGAGPSYLQRLQDYGELFNHYITHPSARLHPVSLVEDGFRDRLTELYPQKSRDREELRYWVSRSGNFSIPTNAKTLGLERISE